MNRALARAAIGLAAVLAFSACSDGRPTVDVRPVEPSKSSPSVDDEDLHFVVYVKPIDPPLTARYFDALEARGVVIDGRGITEQQMLRYGRWACDRADGYVAGAKPTPTDLVADDIEAEGLTRPVAIDLARAARDAGNGTLCKQRLGRADR